MSILQKGIEGSNPSVSAIHKNSPNGAFFMNIDDVGFEPEEEGSQIAQQFGRRATKWRARESGKFIS